ncbi:hypothetical protein H4R19_002301 [Coemansia spiralis]|nr:hypothetical protein H4R19_002301 [Coemansia spiralis]
MSSARATLQVPDDPFASASLSAVLATRRSTTSVAESTRKPSTSSPPPLIQTKLSPTSRRPLMADVTTFLPVPPAAFLPLPGPVITVVFHPVPRASALPGPVAAQTTTQRQPPALPALPALPVPTLQATPTLPRYFPGKNVALARPPPITAAGVPAMPPKSFTPIIPFISNGSTRMLPTATPPAPRNTGSVNVAGIASVLQDVFYLPPDRITIDGKPVANTSPGQPSHKGGVNVVIKDPANTNHGPKKADTAKGAGDDDDDGDQLDDGDEAEAETTTHSLDVDRIRVMATATPQPEADDSSSQNSGDDSDDDGDDHRRSHAAKSVAPTSTPDPDILDLMLPAAEPT